MSVGFFGYLIHPCEFTSNYYKLKRAVGKTALLGFSNSVQAY